ncbi:hypothetical protein L1857_25660 [Amycolatopsis thermalba]|uniref:Uncharacterized protein n=1 Tax=Amycolatopsis thermalba TaxID=944492 RepID=A0ABY4P0Z1_9PSEU|nr:MULTISPECIES: hypothetical protein [Amycolatopsis]UQS25953.1 hypothetical protein L1857_25660 [Amycolatopsis thermalba]
MDEAFTEAGRMVVAGGSLAELISYMRSAPFAATPFNLLRVLTQEVGIPLARAREVLTLIDQDLGSAEGRDAEREWDAIVGQYRTGQVR